MAHNIIPPSSADQSMTCPVRGEAAAGAIPSRSPAARLIPDPFGLTADDGSVSVSVFHPHRERTLRVSVRGLAADAILDDAARDALVAFLTGGTP